MIKQAIRLFSNFLESAPREEVFPGNRLLLDIKATARSVKRWLENEHDVNSNLVLSRCSFFLSLIDLSRKRKCFVESPLDSICLERFLNRLLRKAYPGIETNKRTISTEHEKKLRDGVKGWNNWRAENPKTTPNLTGATLSGCDLREANLEGANLSKAFLNGALIEGANFRNADLREADLQWTYPKGINLTGAKLDGAMF